MGLCVSPRWLNCYSQLRHDLQRGFTVTNAIRCHPPTKMLKCTVKDCALLNRWEFKDWQQVVKLRPDSSHVAFYVLPLPLSPSDVPLLAEDCYFMYYCRRQGRASNCQECRFSSPLPNLLLPVMQRWGGRTLDEQRCVFLSWAYLISVSHQMLEMQRGREEMKPPSAPRGQRGS